MRYSLETIAFGFLSIAALSSWFLNPDVIIRCARNLGIHRRRLKSISEKDDSAPKGAWLLTYPTQGSEYLIDIIHALTKKNTATNYGHVVEEFNGKHTRNVYSSEPVFMERSNGPFIFSNNLPLPVKTYIPVLSYCGGYCVDCYPGRYILTRDTFIKECVTGKKFEPSIYNNGENGFGFTTDVHYWGELIHKALQLARNPFHVIETRFLYITNYYNGDLDWSMLFNPNREGLYSWCDETGVKFSDEESKWYPNGIYDIAVDVPCHAEFFKLIQWHNLVFEAIEHMNLPSKTLYYEDFITDYANQTKSLLNFYELANVVRIEENIVKPVYISNGNFFTDEDKSKIKHFIKTLASNRTWALLERYLTDISDSNLESNVI